MTSQPVSGGSRGYVGVVVSVVCTSIAFVILCLRLLTRAFIVRNIGAEDWVLLVSFALSVTLTALICVEVQHGQGRHIATIDPADLEELYRAFWASVPVYQASLTLTKISILLQYLRVFVGATVRRVIFVFIGVIIVYGIWSVLSTAFMCTPVAYFWNPSIPDGHCLSKVGVWFANASLNIITDVGICVVPMPVLNKLQLPQRQKLALMAVFGLGAFVCLTSVLRLKSLYDVSVSDDQTWDNTPAAYWSSLEVNCSIIAACLPTLRKTISRFFPRFFSTYSQTASRRYTRNNASGFQRFAAHTAAGEWAGTLHTQTMTARDVTQVGTDTKIELDTVRGKNSTSSSDDGTVVDARGEGRIRVMTTITTQEVTPSELEFSDRKISTDSDTAPVVGKPHAF